jgi:transcriptional regulator with XRE-family HTH domain
MSLVTGNQLKAARALAGVDQQQVADAAKINVNTVRNMEARGIDPITSGAVTVRNVQMALEAWGIEFLNHGQPGVRLRDPSAVPAAATAEPPKPVPGTKTAPPKKTRPRRS